MEETIITFETAKLAKEKGFNYPCRGKIECSHYHFIIDNVIPLNINTSNNDMFAPIKNWNVDIKTNRGQFNRYTSLPTQSLLQKWLREVHDIDVIINTYRSQDNKWYKFFISEKSKDILKSDDYKSYEEALEVGLQEALKLIEIVKNK